MNKQEIATITELVNGIQEGFNTFAETLNYGPFEDAMEKLWAYIDTFEKEA